MNNNVVCDNVSPIHLIAVIPLTMKSKHNSKNSKKDLVKCDYCNMNAFANFQKVWVKYNINKNGAYKISKDFINSCLEEPSINENVHLCKKHLRKWINEDI